MNLGAIPEPPIDDVVEVTFFDVSTREFLCGYMGKRSGIAENCPAGASWIEGQFSNAEFKVDATLAVPVALSDAERGARNAIARRSVIIPGLLADIRRLEGSQLRTMRERDLGTMTAIEARDRLRAIDDEIAALRAEIAANGG